MKGNMTASENWLSLGQEENEMEKVFKRMLHFIFYKKLSEVKIILIWKNVSI